MRFKEVKSKLTFIVQDINHLHKLIVHAQRIIRYPVTRHQTQASETLKQQAAYYDTLFHLVEAINDVSKLWGDYEALVAC